MMRWLQELDLWFPGSKFVLTVRRDLRQLISDELSAAGRTRRGPPLRILLRRAHRLKGGGAEAAKRHMEGALETALLAARR
jgi:hypothetical protein